MVKDNALCVSASWDSGKTGHDSITKRVSQKGTHQEIHLDGMPSHHRASCIHIHTHKITQSFTPRSNLA